MSDWKVQVITDAGIYKTVTVEGYVTYSDAANAALGMTGANRIAYCVPTSSPKESETEVTEVHHYYQQQDNNDEEHYQTLDAMEEEMYDLMCQIAMDKGEELPTVSEFYEWLEDND
jgi:hypothetical protein